MTHAVYFLSRNDTAFRQELFTRCWRVVNISYRQRLLIRPNYRSDRDVELAARADAQKINYNASRHTITDNIRDASVSDLARRKEVEQKGRRYSIRYDMTSHTAISVAYNEATGQRLVILRPLV